MGQFKWHKNILLLKQFDVNTCATDSTWLVVKVVV